MQFYMRNEDTLNLLITHDFLEVWDAIYIHHDARRAALEAKELARRVFQVEPELREND
jgi:hypothetical protein